MKNFKNKTMKYLLSILLIAIIFEANAQKITYSIEEDDPYDIKNFSLAIDPLFMDVNAQNMFTAGWGLRADYLMSNKIQGNFDFRTGYATGGYSPDNENNRNYFYTEGALGLVLKDSERKRNVRIILSQSTSGNTTTTISIAGGVPATIRRMILLRGGVYYMNNAIKFSQLNDSITVFESGGTKYTSRDTVISNTLVNSTEAGNTNGFGGFNSVALFVGVDFKKIIQLFVDVDGWGGRANRQYVDFFVDGIFSPVVTLKKFNSNGTEYKVTNKDKRLFGWRMGWSYRQPYDQSFSFRFELGQRPDFIHPGSKLSGYYCMLTWGLYIPMKIGKLYVPEVSTRIVNQ